MAATAVRVFGKPITHGTRSQRALEAKNHQNADGKLDQVLLFSNQSLKAVEGRANAANHVNNTFGRVYNATGGAITYAAFHVWNGGSIEKFPFAIENGQWAVFEHFGSVAALVFNSKDFGESMIAWNNPRKTLLGAHNTAFCEMNDPGYFDNCDWKKIHQKLVASGTESQTAMERYATKVSIEARGNTPCYSAILFSLDDPDM